MNLIEINTCDYGSTGQIMLRSAECARANHHNAYTFSRGWKNNSQKNGHAFIGTYFENAIHHVLGPVTGLNECFSTLGTLSFIRNASDISPDLIHLHNLHGWYINVPLLLRYIKRNKIPVVWTLHDCWPFTGHCPHFAMIGCDKWKGGCCDCTSHREYPESFIDNSRYMHKLKKKWFSGVDNMTIVTPSEWLKDLVEQSFLKYYPVKVINNGIDLSVFKPTDSDFRSRYGIPESKRIILGVAFGWGKRKGLDVFVELSNRLDSNKYQIVLVGTDNAVDKQLPSNIISIHRTHDQAELAEIYTAADLFVNPTREDNYPTVNMESVACGTPVLTFRTGGSPEMLNETCGSVVECDDIDALEREIIRICTTNAYSKEDCLAHAKSFDKNERFKEYIELYESIVHI